MNESLHEVSKSACECEAGHRHVRLVEVSIDGRKVEISTKKHLVADLKILFGVPAEYELEIVEHGEFRPLEDSGHIHIHGDETFISHVRCGDSA